MDVQTLTDMTEVVRACRTQGGTIDEQMAALKKEQAKLREELAAPDFVPGWYLSWDGTSPTDKARGLSLDYIENPAELDFYVRNWGTSSPFTPELAARFFPKTRYDWAKIVKEYPWAKWCAQNECSKITWVYEEKPSAKTKQFVSVGGMCESIRGASPDGYYELEARPEGI